VDKFMIFTFVGLSTSAIYAVISSGLVLTYATTGVFNVAHGAAGMLSAFAYWQLHVAWDIPTLPAALVVLLVLAPLFGVLLERVIMRGLAGTTEATRLVVSISLLVAMIGLAQAVWSPAVGRVVAPFFEGRQLTLTHDVSITYHQLITIATAVVVAAGLRVFLTRTRTGVAMRAVVDDRPLTLLNGVRTDRVAQLSWALSTSLAALGGILIVSSAGLNAATLSLLIVNAYAAAAFGRLRSLPLTFVGALVVGLGDGYLAGYLPQDQRLAGLRPAFPVLVLFAVLLVLPSRPLRTHVRSREYFPAPSLRGAATYCAVLAALGVVLATTLSGPDTISYAKVFAVGIVALSLVPLVGFAGQVSLCQLSFAGIGAAVAAHVSNGTLLGVLTSVVVAALVGGLVALPSLRLSGIYLALATLSFAVVLDRWLFNLPEIAGFAFFPSGSLDIQPLTVLGYAFDTPRRQMLLAVAAFTAMSALVVALRRSRYGRRLLALRDSEAACATFGLNLVGARLGVFMLSAGMAGLGGSLLAMQQSSITAGDFQLLSGLPLFMLVVAGGAGFVSAGLFAGVGLYAALPLLPSLWSGLTRVQPILPGIVGIALGRSPSGAAADISRSFTPLREDAVVLSITVAGCGAWYAVRLLDVFGNPTMWVGMVVTVLVGLGAASRRRRPAGAAAVTPLEWLGVDEPWSASRVADLDRVLRLDQTRMSLSEVPHAAT
jgi:branched-chain amino acid transport system permease protein